jgi:hypothetical protein
LSHLGAAAIVLAVTFICFARGWIGGGDAKLAAATTLWFGFDHLLDYLLFASLFGGALTLLIIQFRVWPLPATLERHEWRMGAAPASTQQRGPLRHRAGRGGARGLPRYHLDETLRYLKRRSETISQASIYSI